MKTQAEKYSEAITALTHRLTTWGVDDAETKARAFMHDMACQGWRAIPIEPIPSRITGTTRPADEATRQANLELARAELAAIRRAPDAIAPTRTAPPPDVGTREPSKAPTGADEMEE